MGLPLKGTRETLPRRPAQPDPGASLTTAPLDCSNLTGRSRRLFDRPTAKLLPRPGRAPSGAVMVPSGIATTWKARPRGNQIRASHCPFGISHAS